MSEAHQPAKSAEPEGKRLTGTCHCGRVVIAIPADTDFKAAKRCDCSLCRRRWAVMATVPKHALELVKGSDSVQLYQFNTNTARHYFCRNCGIYTHHQRRLNPDECGVNIACFDHVNIRDHLDAGINDGINHPSDQR